LLVGAPTLLRIAVPSFVGIEYRYTATIIQSVELLGLLVIVWVIHE
jgi:hypothetical protein